MGLRGDFPAGVKGMIKSMVPGTPENALWQDSYYRAWTRPDTQLLTGEPGRGIVGRALQLTLRPFSWLEDNPMTRTAYFATLNRTKNLSGDEAAMAVRDIMNVVGTNPEMQPFRSQAAKLLWQGAQRITRNQGRMIRGALDVGTGDIKSEEAKALAGIMALWAGTEGLDAATGAVPDSLKKIIEPYYHDKARGGWYFGMGAGGYFTSLPFMLVQDVGDLTRYGASPLKVAKKVAGRVVPLPISGLTQIGKWATGTE
jgi:hypothetical protein